VRFSAISFIFSVILRAGVAACPGTDFGGIFKCVDGIWQGENVTVSSRTLPSYLILLGRLMIGY